MEEKTKIQDLSESILKSMKGLLPNKVVEGVVGVEKSEKGNWKVVVEVVERKAVPDSQDLIGIYEVEVGVKGEILGYKKTKLKVRRDTE